DGRPVGGRASTAGPEPLERVLPGAQGREGLDIPRERPSGVPFRRRTHVGNRRAEEGIGRALEPDRGRQGGLSLLALRLLARLPVPQRGVVRLDGLGEAKIGERVLVAAIHARIVGQGRQCRQRRPHLLRRAFEQLAATGGEQRIAAEYGWRSAHVAEIRDVSGGVARNVHHAQRNGQSGNVDDVTLDQGTRARRYRFVRRSEHRNGVSRDQRRHAAYVIVVVVCRQDRG